ncbi:winged helix DNA-binding domain-containing protein [Arthrobacter sp. ISL-28]|uniref:winged helix DNA-binding domain-containing protein n=1 Tax=Arthrobacter sp. ISL-28 TaxID=2819108 RepID=UPI001BE881E7|nr:winged helix DNA-binding domain-containing protein [Arthrobacter sp. ISL-28]MBT2520554.1 AlkZ family DNA glycosylase [Arthrobacter sp. ISL-28]
MRTGILADDGGLGPGDVVRIRLASQKLRAPLATSAEDALKNLLAVQAQEFAYARWSLAQRTPGATANEIEQAVADGRILRTHILRPTWHFVHREDLTWLRALSAPRLHQANAGMYRRTGIDAAATRSGDVLAAAVAGGRHLTREQLAEELQRAGFAANGPVLAYLIMHAEISGILVSGAPVRTAGGALRQTYAAFDERVVPARAVTQGAPAGPSTVPSVMPSAAPEELSREQALAALALRYFRSRGPASVKDCADWSGLTMADVRQGLQLILEEDQPGLESAVIDGVVFYFAPDNVARRSASGSNSDPALRTDPAPRIDLVQCYDEYIMGYSVSRGYLGGIAPALPVDDAPMHVVLLDGRMAGSWRHRFVQPGKRDQRCELDIRMFDSGGATDGGNALGGRLQDEALARELDRAVRRYEAFIGMPTNRI